MMLELGEIVPKLLQSMARTSLQLNKAATSVLFVVIFRLSQPQVGDSKRMFHFSRIALQKVLATSSRSFPFHVLVSSALLQSAALQLVVQFVGVRAIHIFQTLLCYIPVGLLFIAYPIEILPRSPAQKGIAQTGMPSGKSPHELLYDLVLAIVTSGQTANMAAQGSDALHAGPCGTDKLSRVHVESKLGRTGVVSANLHVWIIAELTRSLWVLHDILWVVHGQDCKEDAFVVSRIVGKQRMLWTNLASLLDVDSAAGLYDSRASVRKSGKMQDVVKQDFLVSTDMLLVCLCGYICSSPTGRGALPE
eukprot:5747450-Amphidinium_carterae.1